MVTIDNFSNHLMSLSNEDWNKLFILIPEIETTKKFGQIEGGDEIIEGVIQLPYWDWEKITQKFVETMYDLNLVINFDWMDWNDGRGMLQNNSHDYNSLDTLTLFKLLTTIIRADRFNDGYLIINFKNGNIIKIIKAIKTTKP